MKVIDLFSGIGGFSLGLESTGGFETVQFVENNEWCQKVLAKNFPNVPITGDIKNYEPKRSERIGLVCGGFPCQPFSVAGKRKGTEDDRHLWPEMLRVIKASKPRWVIGENVRNLTSIQEGMVFEQVCTDLENEGYEVQSFIIPASAVNAPHQRYRVWIVAHSESSESGKQTEWKRGKDTERGSDDIRRTQRKRSKDVGYSKHNGSQDRCKETRGEKRKSEQGRMLESERTSTQQNVENTYNNGQQRGLFETRYQTFTGQRSKIIRRNSANMFGGSSNDGRNYAESTVNGAIQRSCNGNKTESTEPRSVCGVSEESNNDKNTLGENRHQENHDRTLVQEGQIRVQSSLNRGLGEDKTTFERNKIRSGDDTNSRDRVETTTDVANTKCDGLTSTKKRRSIEETIRQESQGENRTLDSQGASGLSETTRNVADSKIIGSNGRKNRNSKEKSGQERILGSKTRGESCDVADSESNQEISELRTTKSEHDKRNSRMESTSSSNRQSLGETKQDVANSEISDRYAHETDREHGETSSQEVFRNRSGIHRQTSWWSSEPNVGRVAHGISDRVDRLKGLGNAIVPQIAYQIGLAILEAEDEYTKVD